MENFHSKQFDWVNKFQPVNMISLKTVKRLGKKHHYCELRNCHFSTYSNRAMANHLTKAHPRYACRECEFETYDKKTYYSHRIYRHGKKNKMVLQIKAILYCPDCSFQTFYQKALDTHKIKHFVEDPDFQVDAGTVSLRRSLRRKSVSITKRNVPKKLCDFKMLRCNWCSYKTIYKKNLRNHESNVHIKDKPTLQKFNCQQCPFNTFNQAILKNHCMVYKHRFLEVKTLRCPICPYTSISDSNLNKHFLSKHKNTIKVGIKSPLSCEDCPFETYNKGSFEKHSIVFKHSEIAVCETKFVKAYACPLCPYTSRIAHRNLEDHMVKHLDARPFQCGQCEYKAKSKHNLAKHRTSNHTNKTLRPYPCKICQRRYRTKSDLNRHLKCHLRYPLKSYPNLDYTKLDKYSCDKCPYESKQRSSLVLHQLVHSDERPFPCELCDWRFKTKRRLHNHLQRHKKDSLEKLYMCSTCARAFAFKNDLAVHEKNHELRKTKGFSCTLCDFKTSLPSCLAGHMRNKHSDVKPFKCDLCEYACKNSVCMKRHKMYIHEKLKRPKKTNSYKCTHPGCNFTTSQQFSLVVHVRTHTGEKPLSCEFCAYKSGNPNSIIIHQRTHTDERPFACTQCDFKARQQVTLINHLRTHTGERPFGCDQCGYRATQKQSLARHVYNMHTSKEEKEAIVQAKALAPKTSKDQKSSMNIESKKKENNSKKIEVSKPKPERAKPWRNPITTKPDSKESGSEIKVAKTKPKRAKPWRNPITTKPKRKGKGDAKGVDPKKRKRSKKVVFSESSENEESEGGTVSDVSLSENEAASGEKNDFVVEENTIIKKKPNPVVKTRNSNCRSNTQRIQTFALEKQTESIQVKQNESYIPYTALSTNSSETVLLNEKDKLEHLKKMTNDMWGNIFNQ